MGPPSKKSSFYRCCPIKSSQITQPHCCNLQKRTLDWQFFYVQSGLWQLVSHQQRLRVFKQMLFWIQRLKYFDFVSLYSRESELLIDAEKSSMGVWGIFYTYFQQWISISFIIIGTKSDHSVALSTHNLCCRMSSCGPWRVRMLSSHNLSLL